MKRAALLVALLSSAAGSVSLSGCAGPVLSQAGAVRRTIKQARDQGAYRCAPRELAIAESHVEFIAIELHDGNYYRAKEELAVARKNAELAVERSPVDQCNPRVKIVAPKKIEITLADRDGDGIPDKTDKCPMESEDKDGFEDEDGCPDPDNDRDGIYDVSDKCPMEPEDKDGFEDEDGCPDPDNDKDGVLDGVDKCPDKAGPPENGGCPDTDKDGDTVVDRVDQCPEVPGPADNNGCPKQKYIVVTQDKIELKQKVHFATNKALIYPDSFAMLNEVADVLKTRGAVRVRIEGHTDSRGSINRNMTLSNDRAASVRNYLIGQGVDASHMESRGFGPTQPIAENRTAAGREQNRRVEFIITAQ